jgi:hypothetical protein
MQLNKIYKIKLAIMSILAVYLTAAIYAPMLCVFRPIVDGKATNISLSGIIFSNGKVNETFFKPLREYMKLNGSTTYMEILWYAVMLMMVITVVMIVGAFLAWVLKSNKKLGFNMLFAGGAIYLICLIATLIVGMILLFAQGSIDNLKFVLMFNVPMVCINVIATIALLVIGVLSFKHFKQPKLSELANNQ